jgi:hypothetical protein
MPATPDTITTATLAYMEVRANADELRANSQGTPMVQARCKLHRSAAGIRYTLDPTR